MAPGASRYTPGYGDDALALMRSRSAEAHAAFLLRRLPPDAAVLDLGCGPGTITLGLAAHVPRGRVVGIDVEPAQVALARRAATDGGVDNMSFLVASADDLPLPDAEVDAVFAHALLEHLAVPVAALREAVRVVRPGGLVAVASSDWSRAQLEPGSPALRDAVDAHRALRRASGGDPDAGGRLEAWLRAVGLEQVRATDAFLADLAPPALAAYVGRRLRAGARRREAEAIETWGRRPDASFRQGWTRALGRRPAAG